jgi:hypothetical protein
MLSAVNIAVASVLAVQWLHNFKPEAGGLFCPDGQRRQIQWGNYRAWQPDDYQLPHHERVTDFRAVAS